MSLLSEPQNRVLNEQPALSSLLLMTLIWIFGAELGLMYLFELFGIEGRWYGPLLDAIGVTVLDMPMIYALWFKPMLKQLQQMRHDQAKLALISQAVEKSPSPAIITDAVGLILYVNPEQCKKSGYSEAEILGKSPRLFKSNTHPDVFYQKLWQTISNGEVWSEKIQNKNKDGTLYWEKQTITPIFDGNTITHYLSIRTEDTERVLAENQLRVSKKNAINFLANMSHEIRTPMNGVLGILELLGDSELNASQAHLVQVGQESASGLLHIINDVLDISKIEAGQINLESVNVDLKALLVSTLQMLRPYATTQNTTLHFHFDSGLPPSLCGDSVRIRQIVVNLLNNAIKFTPGGEVHLEARQYDNNGPYLSIAIRDNGPGIKPDTLKRLFNAFEQADSSTTREFGGTGLGLTIAKELAERMEGHISVESTFGEGSTFTLHLPIKECVDFETENETHSVELTLDNLHILLVEDNTVNQLIATRMLKTLGHEVTVADNGVIALDHLSKTPFDLVFMDFQMPVLDGYETTRRVRAHSSPYQNVPIIGLSADVMPEDRERALKVGMNAFLPKPISTAALRTAISQLFKQLEH